MARPIGSLGRITAAPIPSRSESRGSIWFYSFPKQEPGGAYNPAKVSTHDGNVYQSLVTNADQVVLKLLDEKTAPTPLPATYLIIMFGEDLFFEVNAEKYLLEIDSQLLKEGKITLGARITLDGSRTYLDLKQDEPMRYKDLTLTCRFIHADMGRLKSGYIVEYQHTPGAAVRPVSGIRMPDWKPKGGYDALGRTPTRSFAGRSGPMIMGL